MTAQLQLTRQLNERGVRTRFVATGQTGIMIEGWGIAVDAVVADFIAGAAERLVLEGAKDADVVLVEGQGSINHPGYSGVTLGLLHGSCPDALILCHQSSREYIGDYRQAAWLRIPPLTDYIRLYESIGGAVHPTKVIAISLNTYDMTDAEARRACEAAARETGLPATDPVRFDPDSARGGGRERPGPSRTGAGQHRTVTRAWAAFRYARREKRWWSCRLAPRSSAMLPGAPSRLPSSFLLRRALAFAHPGEPLGAWVRMGRWPLHLRARGRALLASPDLGFLLRRCGRVVVRDGHGAVALDAERLIAWRTLQIVVGAPYLPAVRELRALYPGLRVDNGRIALPLGAGRRGAGARRMCGRTGAGRGHLDRLWRRPLRLTAARARP